MTDRPTQPKRPDREPTLADILGAGIHTLQELSESIGMSVSQLQGDFETKIKADHSKDNTIDRLHNELESYRQDLALRVVQPVIHDLLMLYDDIGALLAGYADDAQPKKVAQVLAHLEDVQNDILVIVERYGFEPFHTLEDTFDRATQRVQKVIATDDETLDYRVARRIRKGLRYGDKIIRPESVEIYRHKESIGKQIEASAPKE